jgi:transposase-like protein
LPESELARLYHHDELSVRAIAARIGVKHDVISALAREYGITLRGSKKKRQPADADWIYREYVVQQRTISDMAQEFGVAINTMSRWVKGHGIAVWRDPRTRQPGQTQS